MTLEIIVFVIAILFGIVCYWRESRNNTLYRFFNKLTHAKKLQMNAKATKGFIYQQNFLIRLVWITLLCIVGAVVLSFVTPVNIIYIQFFASAIVGILLGTYIASFFILAKERTTKEALEETFEKGKEYVEEFTEDIKEKLEPESQTASETKIEKPETPKKSARERLKDKGMI